MSKKDFNDTIGNRTRDVSACIAVPQPTAPPRAPETVTILWLSLLSFFKGALLPNFNRMVKRELLIMGFQ
jgi:hypothetical protein